MLDLGICYSFRYSHERILKLPLLSKKHFPCQVIDLVVRAMEEVMRRLREGALDQNPRLCRKVVCPKCGRAGKRFIDYLREGSFEVGKTERITVAHPGVLSLFRFEEENVTPIYVRSLCEGCGHREVLSDPILTVEYLTGICKYRESRITYV